MHSRWKAGAPAGASQHIAAQQIRTITFSQKLAVNFAITMRFDVHNVSKTTQRICSKIPQGANFSPIKIRWSISFSVVSLMLSTKAKCLLTHAHMQIKSSRARIVSALPCHTGVLICVPNDDQLLSVGATLRPLVTDVGCLAVLTCRLHLVAEVGATVTIGFVVADLQSARTVFHDSDFKGVELQDQGGESQFVSKLLSRVSASVHTGTVT